MSNLDKAIVDVFKAPRFTEQGDRAVDRMLAIVAKGGHTSADKLTALHLGIRCSSSESLTEAQAVSAFNSHFAKGNRKQRIEARVEAATAVVRDLWHPRSRVNVACIENGLLMKIDTNLLNLPLNDARRVVRDARQHFQYL